MLTNINFCIEQTHYSQMQYGRLIQEALPKHQVSAAVYVLFLKLTYQETQVDYINSVFQSVWSKDLQVLKAQS